MGGKTGAPDAPNYQAIADASLKSAELQRQTSIDQLDWAKEQYGDIKPFVTSYLDTTSKASQQQFEAGKSAQDFYEKTYKPIETDLAKTAMDFDNPARRNERASAAMGDVATQFGTAREAALQRLTSFNVDPGSTRFSALDATYRINEAAAKAAAGTQSALQTEAMGIGLKGDLVNTGRGYPGSIANTLGTASNIGSQGIGAANQSFSTGSQAIGTPVQYGSLANQSAGTGIQALNTGFNNKLASAQFDAQQSSGFGSFAGNVLGKVIGGALAL
jgi:hypothetical protein